MQGILRVKVMQTILKYICFVKTQLVKPSVQRNAQSDAMYNTMQCNGLHEAFR